jgi:hypothetical protein
MPLQECCVATGKATGKPSYFGFPEDDALMLKHTGILNAVYDF